MKYGNNYMCNFKKIIICKYIIYIQGKLEVDKRR